MLDRSNIDTYGEVLKKLSKQEWENFVSEVKVNNLSPF